ncbi:hypothetical protein HDR59_04580 [bacterium]|nr:hypothetical protein [bacterium]
MKEKNKSLLITSLISVSMSIISFSAMSADRNMEHNKLTETITTVNQEQNTNFPETDNTKALYPSDVDEEFRIKEYNESFVFYDADNNPINTDDSVKVATYNENVGYKLYNDTVSDTGFITGHKEVEDAGNGVNAGRFFRYWNPSAKSVASRGFQHEYNNDGQYSPSFPKLCYTGATKPYPTENTKITRNGVKVPSTPLIRLASVGGDKNNANQMKYNGRYDFFMPVVSINDANVIKNAGITDAIWTNTTNSNVLKNNVLICNTKDNKCSFTWTGSCFKINPLGAIKLANPDNTTTGYNYITGDNTKIVNCSTKSTTACADADVKSFKGNSSDEAYRISQFVKLDIDGNTDLIEIPQQTCYKCLNVQTTGVEDTSCSYIVNEVFKAKKGDCAATVAALATNPRIVKDYLPANMNNEYNCKSCLCKIEGLLKAKGCN